MVKIMKRIYSQERLQKENGLFPRKGERGVSNPEVGSSNPSLEGTILRGRRQFFF